MTRTADPPTAVSRFEYNLLRILRFLLGHAPAEQAAPLLFARFAPAPPCLTRECLRLVRDTLAKGIVRHLVRAGGWRRERFLRNGTPTEGRVWDRIPLDDRRLAFSRHPVEFLMWLTAEKPTDTKVAWDAPPGELTAADELFFALAYENLRGLPDLIPVLSAKAVFRGNALGWLTYPADLAPADDPAPPDFAPWVTGTRAAILECLQPALARHWLRTERAKGQVEDWRRMRQQGQAEFAALSAFLAAAEKAGRPDLARFVLRTASTLFAGSDPGPEFWTGGLKDPRPPRLADRLAAERAALAVPRQLDTLQRWDRRARGIGYFDEEYAASQLWKADWEAARGDEVTARAKTVLDKLEPLRPAG